MQCNSGVFGGYSAVEPWLAVNNNFAEITVETQNKESPSVLNRFKRMTAFRKKYPTLILGHYHLLVKDAPEIYAYTRTRGDEKLLIILYFSEKARQYKNEFI